MNHVDEAKKIARRLDPQFHSLTESDVRLIRLGIFGGHQSTKGVLEYPDGLKLKAFEAL
jgi:hypothetical protein